ADAHDRRLRAAELRVQLLRHRRLEPRRVRDRAQDGEGRLDGFRRNQDMKLQIPAPLKAEHDELHARLVRATQEPGVLGEAAREVARLLHPHFVKEEAFGLPPLGLLSEVALGAVRADMAEVLVMTRRIKAELPAMFAEHRQIAAALEVLRREAR